MNTYPVKEGQYAKDYNIINEPAFAWWAFDSLQTRYCMISKTKAKYWQATHKHVIMLPHSVKEAIKIDTKNGNDLWQKETEKR